MVRNPKQSVSAITQFSSTFIEMFNHPKQISLSKLLHLFSDYLIHCPKLKFRVTCNEKGKKFETSLKNGNDFVLRLCEIFHKIVVGSKHEVTYELEHIAEDLGRILVALLFVEQKEKEKAFEVFKKLSQVDKTDTVTSVIKSCIEYLNSSNGQAFWNTYNHSKGKLVCCVLEL